MNLLNQQIEIFTRGKSHNNTREEIEVFLSTYKENIQNEIVFLSLALAAPNKVRNPLMGVPQFITVIDEVSTISEAAIDFAKRQSRDSFSKVIVIKHGPENALPPVIVTDSQTTNAFRRWRDYGEALAVWEKSFVCFACLNKGSMNFTYLRSLPAGESYCCDNCANVLITSYRPKVKQSNEPTSQF